jgi:predicted O-methyltransferase YrrM
MEIKPVSECPYPKIEINELANPIPAILIAREFGDTAAFFRDNPAAQRSLVSPISQGLLYTLVRNMRPNVVVEIGTYMGGTTEALCRALHANGQGMLYTVGPFDVPYFQPVFNAWPDELKTRVQFSAVNSMTLYMELEQKRIRPDLVFVDGNHDYEFALFDIQCAARRLMPRGFIVVDNVAQAGPFSAVTDFMKDHPDWLECRVTPPGPEQTYKSFDRNRTAIPYTDFAVLRGPAYHSIGLRSTSFGEVPSQEQRVNGVRLSLAPDRGSGTLHVQCILRAFGETRIEEIVGDAQQIIDPNAEDVEILLDKPISAEGHFVRCAVEPWFIWTGDKPLALRTPPVVI